MQFQKLEILVNGEKQNQFPLICEIAIKFLNCRHWGIYYANKVFTSYILIIYFFLFIDNCGRNQNLFNTYYLHETSALLKFICKKHFCPCSKSDIINYNDLTFKKYLLVNGAEGQKHTAYSQVGSSV